MVGRALKEMGGGHIHVEFAGSSGPQENIYYPINSFL